LQIFSLRVGRKASEQRIDDMPAYFRSAIQQAKVLRYARLI